MMRTMDINNRIEGHMLLCDGEITTDGITLGFDERMNMNMSKFKRLGIRKIKCEMVEDPGYPFSIKLLGMIEAKVIRKYTLGVLKLILLIKRLM
jgi:hypothetical protein